MSDWDVNLAKGQSRSINGADPGLTEVTVGLGWDPRDSIGESYDLDAAAFMLDQNGKLLSKNHFVFFNNLVSPCGGVTHTGDNTTGVGEGDDEQIQLRLSKLSADVKKIVIAVAIHDAETKRQNFGQIDNSYCRVLKGIVTDRSSQTGVLARYELSEDYGTATALVFGEIFRSASNGSWNFKAVGQGYSGGFGALINKFKP